MRIRLLPADQGACRYYRHEQPARVAALEGHEVHIDSHYTIGRAANGDVVAAEQETRVIGGQEMVRRIEADVVVMQRPAKQRTQELIRLFQAQGIAVVVDVDDDVSCLHPQHPHLAGFNPRLNPDTNFHHLATACRMADLVTVTTPALADRYGQHGRVAVLPNCVPAAMLELPRAGDNRTVGWGGQPAMHPGDLEVTHGGVQAAMDRTGWRFRVVGALEDLPRRLGLTSEPDATGFLPLGSYHAALTTLDVGIVPLCDTAFNRAKSRLKGIEYAALGVPFVASPTPEYETLREDGIGLLADDKSKAWRRQLVQLMDDESLRHELAEQGREAIRERHTIETEGWRWIEAWQEAVENRRHAREPVAA